MSNTISNSDDIIDSRDVIARIKELEALKEECDEHIAAGDSPSPYAFSGADELAALKALAAEGRGCADWESGETLIRDSYFKDYAQELADDIGAIDSQGKWSTYCIDWDQAARELQMDYTSVDFDGVTYWTR
jgi:hypothetical protein